MESVKVNDSLIDYLSSYMSNIIEGVDDKNFIMTCTDSYLNRTKIKNRSKYISKKQIKQLVELLHPIYHELNVEIKFIHNKLHGHLLMYNPFSDYVFDDIGTAVYYNHNRTIYIYDYKHRCAISDRSKLSIITSMYHELRHAWQSIYKFDKYKKDHVNYKDCDTPGYRSQWIEKDAIDFSVRMMNKHKDNINEILGINWDWYVSYK